jgi:hypothetical protein
MNKPVLVDLAAAKGKSTGIAVTCRLWDATTNEKLDKDRFRRDLGKVREAYEEILARLQKIVG